MPVTSWIRRNLRAARVNDEGFTLVELVVAMFITMVVMSAMLGIVVESLSSVAKSKQRQAATALANGAMEQLRALPYDTLTVPTLSSVAAGDANLDYTATPPLLKIGLTPGPAYEPLVMNGYSPKTTTSTIDGVVFTVKTYVSQAPGSAAFSLTTAVNYSSSSSHGPQTSVQHSTAFSPSGCLSNVTHPFSGPCQTYFTLQAGMALGGVTVTKVNTLPAFPNAISNMSSANNIAELDLGLPALSTNVLAEQTTSGKGTVATTDARVVDTSGVVTQKFGASTASASVDTDPSTVLAQTVPPTSTLAQNSTAVFSGGTGGTLTAQPFVNDAGQVGASTASDATVCKGADPAGTGLNTAALATNYRPCVSGYEQPQGAGGTVSWVANPAGGFNGLSMTPVQLGPWSSPGRAVAAVLTTANTTACTSGTGPDATGCGHAHASRTLGTSTFGGSISNVGPEFCSSVTVLCTPAAASHIAGDWSITGLAEDAYAETGVGGRGTSYTRAGSISYWCPPGTAGFACTGSSAGYVTVPLTAATSQTLNTVPITTTFTRASGTLQFIESSKITIAAPILTSYTAATCGTTGCSAGGALTAGIVGQTTYTINVINNAGVTVEYTSFVVVANLGGLVAQSSMKVAS